MAGRMQDEAIKAQRARRGGGDGLRTRTPVQRRR